MKNDLQKESLRQLLLAQKVQLLEKIKQERGGMSGRAEAASAQLSALEQSHAQNITERDTAFAIQEHDVAELETTEVALARIAQGTYGVCQDCEADIPITRLLAFPSASRCIACQATAES
jgi:DnaK suppressor protein